MQIKWNLMLLFLLASLLLALPPATFANSPTVQLEPSDSLLVIGQTVQVNITVTDVTNLTGWELKLYYLSSVVSCLGVVEGPFLKQGGSTFKVFDIINDFNGTHGRILAGCILLGPTSVSGSGTLAIIAFEAVGGGVTSLDLMETKLSDEQDPPQPISHLAVDGTITVELDPLIMIDPLISTVNVSDVFDVNVTVVWVTNLTGWEFKLYYLSSVVSCLGVVEGPFLKQGGSTFKVFDIINDFNGTHGRILAGCILLGPTSVSGSGTLAIIAFEAVGGGVTSLDLMETKLSDEQDPPQPISHLTVDGTIVVPYFADVSIMEINISKTIVGQSACASTCMQINVTVTNQGYITEVFNVTLEASRSFSVHEIRLFASASEGWGFTSGNMTKPGPTIIVNEGDLVHLTLTSHDSLLHSFFVDYDGDLIPSVGEPKSPKFTSTISYSFIADTIGSFTYYCQYHKITMYGAFIVNTPTLATAEIGKEEITLLSSSSKILTYCWDTTDFIKGNYTISATADTVTSENDTDNNTMVDGWIFVTLPGDVDGDIDVDIFDIVAIAGAYGSKQGDLKYAPTYDLDCDRDIDIFDIVIATSNYGRRL